MPPRPRLAPAAAPIRLATAANHAGCFNAAFAPVAAAAVGRKSPRRYSTGLPSACSAAESGAEDLADKADAAPQRFDSIKCLHPNTAIAISNVFKYKTMSPVQAAILGKLPTERDMFVTSKTGTGKTLAFLIPAVETLARRRAKNSGKKGGIIVISPTAELASQVANEAHNLCRYHKFGVQKFVGGGNQRAQVASFGHNPADVIVGTPGALDYLMNWSNNFYKLVQNVQVLVLDDADQLLEMDSRKIQDIVDQSPESRQTLLFSTAVPDDLERLASIGLREDHDVFDFVPENEQNVHAHIAQRYAVHDTVKIPQLIHQIARANNNRKIILFCPTDQASRLYSHFLRSAGIRRVFELHAGKPPAIRSTVSDGFRSCQNGVLVTTDLLACGVDYPDVHMVIQLGIPCSRDQYINRIRRTGRAGGGGSALLVLSSWEKSFLKSIADLPIKPCADWSAKTMARKYGGGTLDDPEGDLMRQRGVKSVEEAMVHDYIRSLRVFYMSKQNLVDASAKNLPERLSAFCRAFNVSPPG